MSATASDPISYSSHLAVLFLILVVVPSIIYRIGFELCFPLKERKLTLQDNAKYFFIPSAFIVFFINGVVLKLCPKMLVLRIKTESLIKLDFLNSSNAFAHFLTWFFIILVFNFISGLLCGAYFNETTKDILPKKLGDSLKDRTWDQIFITLVKMNEVVETYVKTKDGDIYKGNLQNYSLDGSNKLEVLILRETVRTIESHKNVNRKKMTISLVDGFFIIPETSIDNIWFRTSYAIGTAVTNNPVLVKFVDDFNSKVPDTKPIG